LPISLFFDVTFLEAIPNDKRSLDFLSSFGTSGLFTGNLKLLRKKDKYEISST